MSDLHVGIFGPGLSGKTTLAKRLSLSLWEKHGIKSIVMDIHREHWGEHAWVTADPAQFEKMVWSETNCAVFIDESSDTIAREKSKTHFFTRIRHKGHKLYVIGHTGASLLPVQREQIQTLFLFRQPGESAKLWADLFGNKKILEASSLAQHEFLWCRFYANTCVRGRLAL